MQETNLKLRNAAFFSVHCMNFKHRNSLLHTVFLLTVLLLAPTAVPAAPAKGSAPINIEADRMISLENTNSVVFKGNVDARQGDLLIRTDKMTVYYRPKDDKEGGPGAGEVQKLICTGNVRISQGDWLGTGQRMDYHAGERKVVLSGNAKAWQGSNMVSGKTITYYLDEGRSIVEGPATATGKKSGKKSGRVKAVIRPGAE